MTPANPAPNEKFDVAEALKTLATWPTGFVNLNPTSPERKMSRIHEALKKAEQERSFTRKPARLDARRRCSNRVQYFNPRPAWRMSERCHADANILDASLGRCGWLAGAGKLNPDPEDDVVGGDEQKTGTANFARCGLGSTECAKTDR